MAYTQTTANKYIFSEVLRDSNTGLGIPGVQVQLFKSNNLDIKSGL